MTTARQSAQSYANAGMQSGRETRNNTRAQFVRPAPKVNSDSLKGLKIAPNTPSKQPQPKQETKTITVDEALSQKNIQTMNADELSDLNQNKMLTASEKEDIEKRKEDLGLNTNPTGKTPEAAKLKTDRDPDEEIADDDKFDIQQGDFIDFLMKEIVLASAAWVGKKVAGQFNVALYKASSTVWHATTDVLEEGWEGTKEFSKKAWQNLKNFEENLGKHLIGYQYIKNAPEEYQNLYNQHNQDIKHARVKIDDADSISRLCLEAVGNDKLNVKEINGKTHWFDPETQRGIPIDDEYVKIILAKAQQIHKNAEKLGLTPEQKERFYQTTAENMSAVLMNGFVVRAQAEIFAANMATAQMVKDSANEEAPKKPREEYIANYKKDFFIMMKKLNNNEPLGNINNLDDLVSASDKARNTACNNQKKGHPEADNQHLTSINNLTTSQERHQDIETIYSAALGSEHLSALNHTLNETNEQIRCLKAAQQANNIRREQINRTRANTSNPHQSPQSQQTPVIGQGRENR